MNLVKNCRMYLFLKLCLESRPLDCGTAIALQGKTEKEYLVNNTTLSVAGLKIVYGVKTNPFAKHDVKKRREKHMGRLC